MQILFHIKTKSFFGFFYIVYETYEKRLMLIVSMIQKVNNMTHYNAHTLCILKHFGHYLTQSLLDDTTVKSIIFAMRHYNMVDSCYIIKCLNIIETINTKTVSKTFYMYYNNMYYAVHLLKNMNRARSVL